VTTAARGARCGLIRVSQAYDFAIWCSARMTIRRCEASSFRPSQMIVTWEPRPGQSARPERVVVSAATATGASIFEGSIAAVGTGAPSADRARFQVSAGRVELDLNVLDAAGRLVDTDVRDVDVPDLSASGQPHPVLLPVEVICLRSRRASETTPRGDALAAYAAPGLFSRKPPDRAGAGRRPDWDGRAGDCSSVESGKADDARP
jgi:hypothetical protein